MESLALTRWQQLYGFHKLQCVSKRLGICKVGGSPPVIFNFGFQTGIPVFTRSQFNYGKSGVAFSSLVDSGSILQNNTKPLPCMVRKTCIRSCPEIRGLFVDIRGGTGLRLDPLKIACSGQKSGICFPATAGDGSSANTSDSIFDETDAASDVISAGSSSSLKPEWLSKLKQVDWNKLIFNWSKDEPMWIVPWTGQTIFQVMVLWFAAFWIMGSWVIPIAAQVVGFSRHSLTFRGQALYSLITDLAEGTVGIWILKRCLARFFPLPNGWFPVKWQGKNWLLEACWGCILFPFVNKLSQLNLYLLPLPTLTTSYVEQSMMSRDPVATLLYAIVISVCAPVWEEIIFRGFLLPSMTRYMPLWGAIFVSALAFALAHFSMQRVLPLTFLGLVMGFVFIRTKNLLASIVLHSLWNGFAFLELL